jgi:hypothetical protein
MLLKVFDSFSQNRNVIPGIAQNGVAPMTKQLPTQASLVVVIDFQQVSLRRKFQFACPAADGTASILVADHLVVDFRGDAVHNFERCLPGAVPPLSFVGRAPLSVPLGGAFPAVRIKPVPVTGEWREIGGRLLQLAVDASLEIGYCPNYWTGSGSVIYDHKGTNA